ncbi:ankyrin repeat domain-containing protein 27-like [Phymastichus coffea]|uniref:ankyrin repeat domain-containing protein 27-like n=1 Tax=Phymastichus coffea TaxID=108790 RepID=UPI00273BC14F|nr:ankyrin repeat domain-containing protein 27-like [Phymastichus coffea]
MNFVCVINVYIELVFYIVTTMGDDELSYNVFYLLLRNKYRKKYDHALTKCWTICVPIGDSLRDISITEKFVDDHILRPLPGSNTQFLSTDEKESHLYQIRNGALKLISDDQSSDDYEVKLTSIEKGYNKEFQPYNIVIIDKPIHKKYRVFSKKSRSGELRLDTSITTYKQAVDFLKDLRNDKFDLLHNLESDIKKMEALKLTDVKDIQTILQKLIRDYWASTMRRQSLDIQRDARFQKLLSLSLEIFVMHQLHDSVYPVLISLLEPGDLLVKNKIDQLIDVSVSPDQLGVKESLVVSLPSAMVELAALDTREGPWEKLMCLKETLDFIVAEIKGAVADVKSRNESLNDNDADLETCVLETTDLISLLLYIIVKCRSQRLRTDLYYIENFIWSISPNDSFSYTIVTFKAALQLLENIDINDLPERNDKVKTELKMGDLLQIVEKDEPKIPLDRQMYCLVKMLEECTTQN